MSTFGTLEKMSKKLNILIKKQTFYTKDFFIMYRMSTYFKT